MFEKFCRRYFVLAPWASLFFLLVGLGVYFSFKNVLLGVDLQSGLDLQITYEGNRVSQQDLVDLLGKTDWTFRVQSVGTAEQGAVFNLRITQAEAQVLPEENEFVDTGDNTAVQPELLVTFQSLEEQVLSFLEKEAPDFEVLRSSYVSPNFSRTMVYQTLFYIIFALLFIFTYIWIRFRWDYALASILTLFHDVLAVLVFFVLLNVEINAITIAALLTIIGYSLNDTIVVFDRIRSNARIHSGLPVKQMVILSLKQVLSRTIITSLTTFFSVLAIYVFSVGSVKDFAFVMLFGVIVGTHSSMGISIPILLSFFRAGGSQRFNEHVPELKIVQ